MSEHVIDIEELAQDDRNFNKGTADGQRLIDQSFKDHGAGRSILLDKDGRIIAGNKSQQAAIAAGIKRVRVIETTGDELVAVKRTDVTLDSKEGREMAFLDNLTTQVNLSWDEVQLESVADEFEDFRPEEFGFEFSDPTEPEPKTEAKEDDFDEDKDTIETRCMSGDIWKLGDHRLMCGDSTKLNNVTRLMDGDLADLWLTDPPYNVGYGMEDSAMMSRRKHRTDGLTVLNDRQDDSSFRKFLVDAYTAASRNLRAGGAFYIWHADTEGYNFRSSLRDVSELTLRETLIWVKNSLCLGRQDYQWRHEPCLYGWKEGAAHFWNSDRKQTTVLEFDRPKKNKEHPTMKPVPLFAYLVQNSTKKGQIVLDTFGGSGTTVVACEETGRIARVMELDPHYCDVIIARWEKLTGLKAEKICGK